MKKTYTRIAGIVLIIFFISNQAGAQYTTKKVKSKHQAYTDSLKQVKYDYVFPVWGQAAYQRGFDIPYPVGIMANYMSLQQGILIENLQLGIKTDNLDIPLTDVDFIEFGKSTNTSYTVNVRPDIWVFPFLNVYGIFGYGNSTTEVNLSKPVELKSVVEQNIKTAGLGVMTAFGIGPVWLSVDANWTWNKPELLDKPVNVNVLGLRLGHTFVFKNRPDRNIAVWAGAMRVNLSSYSSGEVAMKDALPPETWERRDQIVSDYRDWYDGLPPGQKIIVDKTPLPDIIDRLEQADGNTKIRYGMDKQVKERWNGLIGAQFQFNKKWMFRTEGGVIGDRKSVLLSLNYRFLL
jgi:hypothetical protein